MIISNLTVEDIKFLKDLKQELNTQSNRMTANPRFYQIQHDVFIPSIDGDGNYFEAVVDGERLGIYTNDNKGLEELKDILLLNYDEEDLEDIEEINSLNLEELDNKSLDLKCYVGDYKHVYDNAFLTEKACKQHIESNKHHYRNPMDYLSYAFRNPELNQLLEILSKIEIE